MAEVAERKRVYGIWNDHGVPREVDFNRVWSDHEFSDEEVGALLAGEVIVFDTVSKRTGKPYKACGYLAEQTIDRDGGERSFIGFKLDFDAMPDRIPDTICGHRITDAERSSLEAGDSVFVEGLVSKRTGNSFSAYLTWGADPEREGHRRILFSFDDPE